MKKESIAEAKPHIRACISSSTYIISLIPRHAQLLQVLTLKTSHFASLQKYFGFTFSISTSWWSIETKNRIFERKKVS
jgi:hypothetical protein